MNVSLKRFAPLVLEHKKEVEDSTIWKEGQYKMMEEVIPSRLSNNLYCLKFLKKRMYIYLMFKIYLYDSLNFNVYICQ